MEHDTATEVFTPRFNVNVQLTGTDGNAWAIMGKVQKALRDAGATKDDINEFLDEAMSDSYDHLLSTCMAWVHVFKTRHRTQASNNFENVLIDLPELTWDDPDPSWRLDAACRPDEDAPPNTPVFFTAAEKEFAVAVCWDICPVQDRCLEYAMKNRPSSGVWGGYTEKELKEMYREAQ